MSENKLIASVVGDACRIAREERGWTSEQVSESLRVNNEFYDQIERGFSVPDMYLLVRMARLFRLDLDELIVELYGE